MEDTPADPSDRIVTGCPAQEGNRFALTGRGGLPENPTEPFIGAAVWRDLRPTGIPAQSQTRQSALPRSPVSPTPPPLVEVTGWAIDSRGRLVLTATRPSHYSLFSHSCP